MEMKVQLEIGNKSPFKYLWTLRFDQSDKNEHTNYLGNHRGP